MGVVKDVYLSQWNASKLNMSITGTCTRQLPFRERAGKDQFETNRIRKCYLDCFISDLKFPLGFDFLSSAGLRKEKGLR